MKIREGREKYWEDVWDLNQTDDYSKAAIECSKYWAELMESQMDSGKKLEDVAKDTSFEASAKYEITGAMYNAGLELLVKYWLYGEDLMKWHNRRYAPSEEEGDKLTEERRLINTSVVEMEF